MTSQIWVPDGTVVRGFVDVSADLFVELAKCQEKDRVERHISVTSDALPQSAKVRSVSALPDNVIRIELDGTEARQYTPAFEERLESTYPGCQIKSDERRTVAQKAMGDLLWAMGLEFKSRLVLPNNTDDIKLELFFKLGNMILGDECPQQFRG